MNNDCPYCEGTGTIENDEGDIEDCPDCEGSGIDPEHDKP